MDNSKVRSSGIDSFEASPLESEIDKLASDIYQDMQGKDLPPEKLWHFTNATGLKGILETQELWATNSLFMNDRSELSYGVEFIENFLTREVECDNPVYRAMAEDIGLMGARGRTNPYIVSFSSQPDDLVQWLVYADRCRGYAIGFDREHLARGVRSGTTGLNELDFFRLVRVIYDPLEQTTILANLVSRAASLIDASGIDPTGGGGSVMSAVRSVARTLLLSFKAPEFKHECEWRLVVSHGIAAEITFRFRATDQGISPYLPYQLKADERNWGRPCVMSGSALDRELQEYTFARWNRGSVRKVEYQHSKVRFRP